MLAAIIFWGSSTPEQSITFTDSLFLTVSAMTQAGLNTINLSQLNTWQQIILFILILIGSSVLISSVVVHTRKSAFEKRFADIVEKERERRKALRSPRSFHRTSTQQKTNASEAPPPAVNGFVTIGQPNRPTAPATNAVGVEAHGENNEKILRQTTPPTRYNGATVTEDVDDIRHGRSEGDISGSALASASASPPLHTSFNRIKFAEDQPGKVLSNRRRQGSLEVMTHAASHLHLSSPRTPHIPTSRANNEEDDETEGGIRMSATRREEFRSTSKYFDSDGIIGRNSQFHSLSLTERERLGGVEYRALVLLEIIVIAYYILFQLIGCLGLGAWIAYNQSSTTLENGLNPWWTGIFLGVSAFNNNGMSLLDASK